MTKIPMTAAGFNRLQDELKQLKTVERPAIIRADRGGARPWRHLRERRIPRRARTPELHRGPRHRARGQDRPRRGDRRLQAVRQDRQVRRHRDPGRRGDRRRGRLPDRRRGRGRHQQGPAVGDLAAGPRADRQGHRRQRRGHRPRAAPAPTRSSRSASARLQLLSVDLDRHARLVLRGADRQRRAHMRHIGRRGEPAW